MQYDKDTTSEFGDVFHKIRRILLSYPQIKEIKNAKQTSYHDENGAVVMMRTNGEKLVLAFAKGYKLQEKHPMLQGNGKVVRHLYFDSNETVDEALLKEMIEESFILGIEAAEMKKLRRK